MEACVLKVALLRV